MKYRALFALPVIVSALGFFVDVYDLLIFSIVRVPSLQSLGYSEAEVSKIGTFIFNCQQAGLLVGGIVWGIWGDKRGRLSVLFGSIITYSLANIACGFVEDPNLYALLRFVAGVGLSGEIGAAMTLVTEIVPKEIRSLGPTLVAGIGYLGAGAAYLTQEWFTWRTAYMVGGGMGLLLLLLRISVFESGLFLQLKETKVSRGNYLYFFSSWPRLVKYFRCVLIGVPTWFVVGILGTFGNEFGKALGIDEGISPGKCVMFIYFGLTAGDFFSGPLSHWLQSRRKAILFLLFIGVIFVGIYLFGGVRSANMLYVVCFLTGVCTGYIGLYLMMVAELYGTNLRATATTSVPSVVRGMAIPMTLAFQGLKPSFGALGGAALLGVLCYGLALLAIYKTDETFGRNLDFVEE
ncbi:putative MFS family arabinose efflux permease [Runella defluvii]|uniref:Putative MFS family arabinose efflux permease n=1 Tax=Runella defluvii TaxID=370973 RepID=A0A7W5ZIU2_9BACT|nr:MFS transporter [Runella defluvii]MBB3837430.1 putative MFS family arabinose efflux permease [Runella defluvii]